MNKKKGQMQTFISLIVGLVIIAFTFAIGMALSQGVADQALVDCGGNASDCSYAYNGTVEILGALATIPGWVKLLVLAVVGLALVGVVFLFNRLRQ